MSRPPSVGHGVAYDPVPNPQEHSDTPLSYYESASEQPSPAQGSPAPQMSDLNVNDTNDLNPEEQSVNLVPPRFLGAIGGEGLRESVGTFSSRDRSEGLSSLYALNPESLSARGSPRPESQDFGSPYRDDPRSLPDDPFDGPSVPLSELSSQPRFLSEKQGVYPSKTSKSRRNTIILAALGGLLLLIVAVILPVYFLVIKHNSNKAASSQQSGTATAPSPSGTKSPNSQNLITGGDGSTVTMDDGTTFTYHNSFGGYWYSDPNNPLANSARPQSWVPALNQTFNHGTDRVRGVNLGGWLVTEPFISPALYQKYPGAVDEWTLSQAMAQDTAGGGLNQLENHYKTFILAIICGKMQTEQDFAQIAGAGLNYVRLPIPYWAIETRDGEPFLAKTSWKYFLKAIGWARKYGIRINLDLHSLPGSQNGWNHSGRLGTINVLNGPMGLANAERSLDYIRIIAEFISQPQYRDVVTLFGITNEPQASTVGLDSLSRYYLQAYTYIRLASGTGTGNGPTISFHDGFSGTTEWANFLPGADRIALDVHPYLCFTAQSAASMSSRTAEPCTWGSMMNDSMTAFGLTTAGEFSNAINDCGLFVNGVGLGTRYDGTYTTGGPWPKVGDCAQWNDYTKWDQTMKDSTKQFALASMDALQNWFFWTWKIGNSTSGIVEAPFWSYQLGLENGWMPTDPRMANGVCGNSHPWQPPLAPSQTGGSGAGNIPSSVSAKLAWPPTSISNAGAAVTLLPQYTRTGTIPTLPAPSFTGKKSVSAGDGWENPSDTLGLAVPIASCTYPSAWMESGFSVPPVCGAQSTGRRRDVSPAEPTITPAPPIPSR